MKKNIVISSLVVILGIVGIYSFNRPKSDSVPSYDVSASTQTQNQANVFENILQQEPQVKMSSTGICHQKGSTYYSRTQNFTPYNSISDCLNAGGRMPKK